MAIDMQIHVMASLLRRGESLDRLSTGLALLGGLIGMGHGLLGPFNSGVAGACCALMILGVLQKYLAIRVALDADLLQRLADSPQALNEGFQALDQALSALGLQPAANAGRPWDQRRRGMLGLLYRQATMIAVQVTLTLGLMLASPWLSNNR